MQIRLACGQLIDKWQMKIQPFVGGTIPLVGETGE